jgi:hypothetical protein
VLARHPEGRGRRSKVVRSNRVNEAAHLVTRPQGRWPYLQLLIACYVRSPACHGDLLRLPAQPVRRWRARIFGLVQLRSKPCEGRRSRVVR